MIPVHSLSDWPVVRHHETRLISFCDMALCPTSLQPKDLLLNAIQEVSEEICCILMVICAEGKEMSTKP